MECGVNQLVIEAHPAFLVPLASYGTRYPPLSVFHFGSSRESIVILAGLQSSTYHGAYAPRSRVHFVVADLTTIALGPLYATGYGRRNCSGKAISPSASNMSSRHHALAENFADDRRSASIASYSRTRTSISSE